MIKQEKNLKMRSRIYISMKMNNKTMVMNSKIMKSQFHNKNLVIYCNNQ